MDSQYTLYIEFSFRDRTAYHVGDDFGVAEKIAKILFGNNFSIDKIYIMDNYSNTIVKEIERG